MSSTVAIIGFIAIFVLAAFLLVLPRLAGRRDRGPRPTPRPGAGRPVAPPPPARSEPVAPEPVVGGTVAAPRLRDRLVRTRATFAGLVGTLRRGGGIGEHEWDEVEETLLLADVGLVTTGRILEGVRARVAAAGAVDASVLPALLRDEVEAQLVTGAPDRSLRLVPGQPNVWLLVGVNGVGKTTTAAKLARRSQREGVRVLLAAADTFRAAAADQLGEWAARLDVPLVRGQDGGDPGSVVFDALDAASARGIDLVLVDTAGRLHTKVNLMNELAKLRRIVERRPGALQEVLLVLDASTGQNGLAQAREFTEAIDVTGVVLTKLDGTAKGGIVLAIEAELGVPVKLVGLGEAPEDLVPFDPAEFAAALVD